MLCLVTLLRPVQCSLWQTWFWCWTETDAVPPLGKPAACAGLRPLQCSLQADLLYVLQGLWTVNTVTLVLSVVESMLVTWGKPRAKPESMKFDVGHPNRQPKLVCKRPIRCKHELTLV